jgi:hypothetical protein
MFPQLRQRIGPALDLIVEFSTLGEYRWDADGVLRPASALAHAPERAPQLGGAGDSVAGRAAVRRNVAGGAAGLSPAATPAARRVGRDVHTSQAAGQLACRGERRHSTAAERSGPHPSSPPGPRSPRPSSPPGPFAPRPSLAPGPRSPRPNSAPGPRSPRPKPRPRVAPAGEQLCLAV